MRPPWAPDPYQPPRRSTSGWAIATLVLGLLSCVPLSVAFGIVALIKIGAEGGRQQGRGLAIAGMAIAGLWVLVWVVVAFVVQTDYFLVTGTVQSSPVLTVGDCYDDHNHRIGCDQPHSEEVVAVLSLSRFPHTDADRNELTKRCKAELQHYSPTATRDPNMRVVVSGPGTDWKYLNNHTAGCLADFTPDRVGSIKG